MQPIRKLSEWLEMHSNRQAYLFTPNDLRALFPEMSDSSYKTLLSRSASGGKLIRICRGLYGVKGAINQTGRLLFHAAARLRADHFNYISLETALSDKGVISQIPFNWITLLTSGRSGIINCGRFGKIEFIHTAKNPAALAKELAYDSECRLWRASVRLAIRDMKATKRNCDLIDQEAANEFI